MDNIFSLDKHYADEMIAHTRSEAPNECCGIPFHYTIEPMELIAVYRELEQNGWELLAVYHSHTSTDGYPSPIDIESALLPGWN
jgi:proteasome lid subunit RPN8/RPN11